MMPTADANGDNACCTHVSQVCRLQQQRLLLGLHLAQLGVVLLPHSGRGGAAVGAGTSLRAKTSDAALRYCVVVLAR